MRLYVFLSRHTQRWDPSCPSPFPLIPFIPLSSLPSLSCHARSLGRGFCPPLPPTPINTNTNIGINDTYEYFAH